MSMNRLLSVAVAFVAAGTLCLAQTEKTQVIENGGTGPWKSIRN